MKKIRNLIIILVILIIIVLGILIKILQEAKNNLSQQEDDFVLGSTDVVQNYNLEKVTIRNDYYTVKNIVDKYYIALCDLNKTSEDALADKELTKKRIYDFFDENCVKEIGLTIENIQEKLGNYNDLNVLIEDMYVRDVTENIKLYFISGIITEKEKTTKENFKLIIGLDCYNLAFNIYTQDYAKKYNFQDANSQINISEIKKRTYNKYDIKIVKDEEYAQELLKSYTQSIMYNNINYSYERLDEQYKTNKFKEITDYEKYIQDNRKSIISAVLDSYKINIYEEYIQFVCLDTKGKYYIFNQKSIMDYDLILDIYTVDLPEFVEKYEVATNEEKVTLNIQKFMEALKYKDYKYLYSKLDETFKKNKFPTESVFEEYFERNFSNVDIEFMELIQQGDIYIYKSKLKKDSKERIFNIIMKLNEGTDFVVSFSAE